MASGFNTAGSDQRDSTTAARDWLTTKVLRVDSLSSLSLELREKIRTTLLEHTYDTAKLHDTI